MSRALEVGCGVGRATFELAREYPEVVGIDYSQAFVAKCQELKRAGQADYWMCTEGDLGVHKTAYVDPAIVRAVFMYNWDCTHCSHTAITPI